jgi:hypothetical protein
MNKLCLGLQIVTILTLLNNENSLIIAISSTQQDPSSEVDSHSSGHETPRLLRNTKVHYRVHKGLLL